MKTNIKNSSLTSLAKVQPRITMASFGSVLWMLVLLLGGGAFEVKAAAFTSCAAVTEIPVAECNALVALYDGTNGPAWSDSTGWKTTDTPCNWVGITCSTGGPPRNVTGIYRISKNLQGNLPSLGFGLLQSLYLSDNKLTGPIPVFPSKLEYIDLSNNQLTGTFSPSLFVFPAELFLKELNLGHNQLTGTVPNLVDFNNLTKLHLNNNSLTGTLPDFDGLLGLKELNLSSNQLNGTIPNFTNFVNLTTLDLSNNQFSGSSPNFNRVTSLKYLYLSNNQLTGTIPDFTANHTGVTNTKIVRLRELHLDRNQFTGEIPSSITQLPILTSQLPLTYLSLWYNQLTTTDPNVISFLDSRDPYWRIQTSSLPVFTSIPSNFAKVGEIYSYNISAQWSSKLTITVTKPAWLNFTDNGNNTALLTGTPTTAGTYSVEIQIQDSQGATSTQTFDIEVLDTSVPTDFVTTSPPTTVTVGQVYSYDIVVQGSKVPLTLTATTKPAWLTFTPQMENKKALLTGTPTSCDETKKNPHNVSMELKDNQGTTKTQNFAINVIENPSCIPPLPPVYSLTLTTTITSMLKGSKVNVTGQLISSKSNVGSVPITLTLTAPDKTIRILSPSPTTNGTGEYLGEVTGLDQVGTYTLEASFDDFTTSLSPDVSKAITLNVVESSITLSEITLPQEGAEIDQQALPMIVGKATDASQGTWIDRVELTLQDQTTLQYLNLNSTTSPNPIWIATEGTTEWFVNTDKVTWVPGHSYFITARAVDLAGEFSAEKTAKFSIGMEKMTTALSLKTSKNSLAPSDNQVEVTGTFTYTPIPTLPTPDLSTLVIHWILKTPDGGKVTGDTNLKSDSTFQFPLTAFDKIGGYTLEAFFDENETLLDSVSNPENITMSSGKLEILHPANGSTVKTLPWISGQAYDPLIKEVKIAVKLNKSDENGRYKYLKLDNLGGRFEVVKNDQPNWIPATGLTPWVVNVSKVILIDKQDYTIMAQGFDGQNIIETPPTTFTFDIDRDVQAHTAVALTLDSPTLLVGEPLNLKGKLDRYPYEGQDLNGRLIEVTIESPDQKVTTIEVKTHDNEGHFELTDIAVFDREGAYRMNASFAGDAVLSPALSEPQRLLVGQTAGYAILVQGKTADNEGLKAHIKTVKRVYQQLKDRGLNDSNIYYYGDDQSKLSGVNIMPDRANIETRFKELGERINGVPAPLYVILVDHGGVGGNFYLNGEQKITAKDLNDWLQKLEGGLESDLAKQQPRVIVMGACYSGSFIRPLSKEGRIIITSVAENEVSYKGPVEPTDGIRTGELFVQELFDALGRDLSLAKAFEKAAETLRVYTRSGVPMSYPRRFADDAIQHPLLDDNGDQMGSNVLYKDGRKAAGVYLGVNRIPKTRLTADISTVPAPVVHLSAQENIFKPSLEVINASRIKTATVDIRGPNEKLSKEDKEQTEQAQIKQLPRIFFSCPKGASQESTSCQTATQSLPQFEASGKYDIFYFVNDIDPNYVSPLWHSVVYKAKEGNSPPKPVTLLKPIKDGKAQTTLMFDWENATDPDFDPRKDSFSYILQVAQDAEFTKMVYEQSEIRFSQHYMDGNTKVNVWDKNAQVPTEQFGLRDQTTYFWRVIAVDNYGAQSEPSEGFSFTTDNPNEKTDCTDPNYSGGATAAENIQCPTDPIDLVITLSEQPGEIVANFPPEINEGNKINLVVGRENGSQGRMTVDYLLEGAIPDSGQGGPLVWEDGDIDPKQIYPRINDDVFTGNRQFTITLSNLNGDPNWTISQTITIIEDEQQLRPGLIQFHGLIQFQTPSLDVDDKSGSAKLLVGRVNGTDGDVSVNWVAHSNGQEIKRDYLTWMSNDGTDRYIDLPISDVQGDQVIQVTLEGDPAWLGEPRDANVMVKDVGFIPPVVPAGTLQFAPTRLEIQEGEAPLIIDVTRTDGAAGEVRVDYCVIEGQSTAQLDRDFNIEGGGTCSTFTWFDGDATSKPIALVAYNEGEMEGAETVTLQLLNPTGGANLGMDRVTVTINEVIPLCTKDQSKIQFSSPTVANAREDIGLVTFTAIRTECYEGEISVNYEVTPDSTATPDLDYTGATTGTLSWPHGDSQPKTVMLTIVNDTLPESDKEIKLRLTGVGEPQMVSLVVEDDDDISPPPLPKIQFVTPSPEVEESGGTITFEVTCIPTDNRPCEGSASFSLTGTATPGSDYETPNTNGQLTWQTGDSQPKFISVTLKDDDLSDEAPQLLVINLTNPIGVELGDPAMVTMTIKDDDKKPPLTTVQFSQPEYRIVEGEAEFVDIMVTRQGDSQVEASVICNRGEEPLPEHLIEWRLADETVAKNCQRVEIEDDNVITGEREITFSLSNPHHTTKIGEPATAKLIIEEDDKPCTPRFTTAEVPVSEADKEAVLTVECVNGADGVEVTTDYQTENGTAIAGEDYQSSPGTLTFTQDHTAETIRIPLVNDDAKEADEQLVVRLSPPQEEKVTITLKDDEIILPTLECEAMDNTGGHPSLDKVTICEGGIAIEKGDFTQTGILSLAQTVKVMGRMTVDPQHVGKDAELILFAGFCPMNQICDKDSETYFMMDTAGVISQWSHDVSELTAWQTAKLLEKTFSVTLYEGQFILPGRLTVFFGYRLAEDGTVVQNQLPIEVQIDE